MEKPNALFEAWHNHKATDRALRAKLAEVYKPGSAIKWRHATYVQEGVVVSVGSSHVTVFNEKTRRNVQVNVYSILEAYYRPAEL